jgi:hypothetical protein
MEDGVPERIFDAACEGKVEEVREFLSSAAAPRDVVHCIDYLGIDGTILSCLTSGRPFDARHVELVRQLISLGANANHIDSQGASPLIYLLHCFGAACSGKAVIDMISLLLGAGADVNHEGGTQGGRPCSIAFGFPISVVVRKLNRSNCPDSALIEEVVTMLLRAGASVDTSSASNPSGWQATRAVCVGVYQSLDDPRCAELVADPHFLTIKAQIHGVHKAGSWRAYIMAPRLEVLTLRGLANRGKIRSTDPALNNLVALPNELICQVLAFWFG